MLLDSSRGYRGGPIGCRNGVFVVGVLAAALASSMLASGARAEGTAQLGANQDVIETTQIKVDVLNVGEVINIVAGNDSTASDATTAVVVEVLDPTGTAVAGSPFAIYDGRPGWLGQPDVVPTAADIAAMPQGPLQVTAAMVGTYSLSFDNLRVFSGNNADINRVIDPLDITVTPNAATAVDPANPPGSFGRVHSNRWRLNAHSFDESAATDAAFFVLTPTGPDSDFTWKLQFAGLAGFFYEVTGNDVGLPAPNSGVSEDQRDVSGPRALYPVYLNVPETAQGGDPVPTLTDFVAGGPADLCTCSIGGLESQFIFESSSEGVYEIVIDVDKDGEFDPAAGDVLLKGVTVSGENVVTWDGRDNFGADVGPGSYQTQLSVRLGEFHFVANDIETSKPGLRIFGVNPPLPATTPTSANMLWDDTRINESLAFYDASGALLQNVTIDPAHRSMPASTLATGGLASGDPGDEPVCGGNSHCWGGFTDAQVTLSNGSNEIASPGNYRYIDTYVFFKEAVLTTAACVVAAEADPDGDGLTNFQECDGPIFTDPNSADSDGDGLSDGAELGGNVQTDPLNPDSDGDGLPDGVEDQNGDGSFDPGETDPTNPDTDGDGLEDGVEDANANGMVDEGETDPTNPDTDGDGLPDGVEDANQNGMVDPGETDPTKADTDGDGLPDGVEDANANGSVDAGETDPADPDSDGDGLPDGLEDANHNGRRDPGETDPTNPDSDGDGLADGDEDANANGVIDDGETDPNAADSDADGLSDGLERGIDASGNPIPNANRTDPLVRDSDGDGLLDGEEDENKNGTREDDETDPNEVDTDGDGLGDGIEVGVDGDGDPIDRATKTNPLDPDTDGDDLPDGVEDENRDGVYQQGVETDPTDDDSDGDGLLDGDEDKDHDGALDDDETDPRDADTDGGGEPDGSEVNITGHDPRDPSDDRPPNVALVGGGCKCGIAPAPHAGMSAGPWALAFGLLFGWRVRRKRRRRQAPAANQPSCSSSER
ncbi:MAG: hypothetical protein OEZ06_26315 [Myxococcales bacterium]|nr:hypothetical protein [Myxococcales bacterium]